MFDTSPTVSVLSTFLDTQDQMSQENKEYLLSMYKKTLKTNTNSKKIKKIKKIVRLNDYKQATSKEDLSTMKGSNLKKILQLNNKNKNGSKSELVDRVWWLLHPNTDPPKHLELKKRGRPSSIKSKGPAFISDSEEDDNNMEELLLQHNIPKIWNKLYISNHKISSSGRECYRYKQTKYIFKKTIDSGYVPQGYINDNQHIESITTDTMNNAVTEILNSFN